MPTATNRYYTLAIVSDLAISLPSWSDKSNSILIDAAAVNRINVAEGSRIDVQCVQGKFSASVKDCMCLSCALSGRDSVLRDAQGITSGDFAGLIGTIENGDAYANVHTDNFPSGEIRGWLQPPSANK
jgi:CHRD domain